MRTILKRILFISLFFSATALSAMQENLLKWTAVIEVIAKAGGGTLVWKVLKEQARKKKRNYFCSRSLLSSNLELVSGAKTGDIKKVAKALADGADVNWEDTLRDHFASPSNTALIYAARSDHFETVKLLLENGANVNQKNKFGSAALTYSVRKGYPEIVKSLLERNADFKGEDFCCYTPLMRAAQGEKYYSTEKNLNLVKKENYARIINLLLNLTDPWAKSSRGKNTLEQVNGSETIERYVQKKIFETLERTVPRCPPEVNNIIAMFAAYGKNLLECEPAQ